MMAVAGDVLFKYEQTNTTISTTDPDYLKFRELSGTNPPSRKIFNF